MKVVEHDSPSEFLARAGPFLEAAEVENNLMLGIARRLVDGPDPDRPTAYLATVEDDSGVVAAAVRTPPHKLVLTRADTAAIDALTDALRSTGSWPPELLAPTGTAETFAEAWSARVGCGWWIASRERVHELTEVRPIPPVPGRLRLASAAELERLAAWTRGFAEDAGLPETDEEAARALTLDRIARRSLYVWEDSEPVSMAAVVRISERGVRISLVYTPPDRRRRGYASGSVAALSRAMLDSGNRYCCLFTDLANPTSNHIYAVIGYRPIVDMYTIAFEPSSAASDDRSGDHARSAG